MYMLELSNYNNALLTATFAWRIVLSDAAKRRNHSRRLLSEEARSNTNGDELQQIPRVLLALATGGYDVANTTARYAVFSNGHRYNIMHYMIKRLSGLHNN